MHTMYLHTCNDTMEERARTHMSTVVAYTYCASGENEFEEEIITSYSTPQNCPDVSLILGLKCVMHSRWLLQRDVVQ